VSILNRSAAVVKSAAALLAGNPLRAQSSWRSPFTGFTDTPGAIESRNAYMTMSSIFGCVTAYAMNDPQVKLRVEHLDGTPWPEHPVQWLIRHPNDDMGEKEVRLFNCIYKPLGGASQLYLYRNTKGQVIGWRPLSTNEIQPVAVSDRPIGRGSWTDFYWHHTLNGAPERVEARDVISLRFPSIHPITPQGYLSPIAAAFMDVTSDLEITKLPTDLMRNAAFISWVFSLGQGSEGLDDAEFEQVKADIAASHSGKNKFSPLVVRAAGSAEFKGIDFRSMEFSKLGSRPEIRLSVACRVPIRYLGFAAGIDASTSDNYVGSWISFVKDSVLGQAMLDADTMTNALTREDWAQHPVAILYGLDRNANNEFRIVPDTSDVQALKTELLAKHDDARKNHAEGGITLDEFRSDIGKSEVGPARGGDKFAERVSVPGTMPQDRSTNVMKTPQPKE
jgi:hypothetical protein